MAFEHAPRGADFTERGMMPAMMVPRLGDPAAVLTEQARARWHTLQQRREDARAVVSPLYDAVTDLRMDRQREEARLRQLTLPRSSGGHGLKASTDKETSSDIQVLDVERRIAGISDEMARKQTLIDDRSARSNNIGRLVDRIEAWLGGGVPGGCKVTDHTEIAVGSILKRNETEVAALDRLRRRLRELAADRQRVESAPHPSSESVAKARAAIEQMAERGAPNVDALVEVGADIAWPQTMQSLDLIGFAISRAGEAQLGGRAQGEVSDPLGVLCWLHRDALLAKIEAAIIESSDDAAALTTAQREQKLAEIASDHLQVEREECSLLWNMQHGGAAVEFRQDADIHAVLGIALEVATDRVLPFGQAADAYSHTVEVMR